MIEIQATPIRRFANRKIFYLGLMLGFARITSGLLISKLNLNFDYFIDILIFFYIGIWLCFEKRNFTLKQVVLANIFIVTISIVITDLFSFFYWNNSTTISAFLMKKSITAAYILILSIVCSVCWFYGIKIIYSKKWK